MALKELNTCTAEELEPLSSNCNQLQAVTENIEIIIDPNALGDISSMERAQVVICMPPIHLSVPLTPKI